MGINITELRRLETEMARADKLESLGVLAGGIAHDFNNMLASIVTNRQIAIQDIPEDVRSRHHLEASVRPMRARNLTQQLLTFSKGGEPVKEVIDLAPLARSSVDFMLSGTNAAAVYGFEDGEYYANVDPIQIEQVIGNLAMNASQAMPKGGHIYVNMKKLSDPDIDLLSIRPGPYIRIDVRDEGCGIPKDVLDKIFEPFFTTKETGSGLGLATVQSIIRNHEGHVRVDSQVGKGTTVSIILPSVDHDIASSIPVKVRLEVRQPGRILVMDDEEPIREALSAILADFGYDPISVRNGEEAIDAYRDAISEKRPFGVVIMDLTIRGGMGGKEAAQHILAMDPQAKMIVSSGYSNDPIMAHPEEYGFCDISP